MVHFAKHQNPLKCLLALVVVLIGFAHAGPARAATFSVDTVVDLDYPLATGEYFWDDEGVPRGRMVIVVDLSAERLFVYRGGVEIARSSIVQGYGRKPTPTGTYTILEKDADHYSSTYGGAPMPYMLRLTWGGISIHGSEVADDAATHGCIGVPEDFAATLYRSMRIGDAVLVTRDWLPSEYRNP